MKSNGHQRRRRTRQELIDAGYYQATKVSPGFQVFISGDQPPQYEPLKDREKRMRAEEQAQRQVKGRAQQPRLPGANQAQKQLGSGRTKKTRKKPGQM